MRIKQRINYRKIENNSYTTDIYSHTSRQYIVNHQDHLRARNIQSVWASLQKNVDKLFKKTLDDICIYNTEFKDICLARYELAKEKRKFKNQKLVFLMILHIAYIKRYISIKKCDIIDCKDDITDTFFGIRKFIIQDYQFFELINDIIPNTINQMSINNWFRRSGFRPLNSDWISFWNTNDIQTTYSTKVMEYVGLRK